MAHGLLDHLGDPPEATATALTQTLWGSGMGDTFREHLADTFLQVITPEDHAQALELIR
ncbi:hypothetical protein ACWD7B_00830 [Streptomyces rubiginosohelvolus]